MKILFLTDGVYPFVLGGMQKHATYVIRNFADSEHQITVAFTAHEPISKETIAERLFDGAIPANIDFDFVDFPEIPKFYGHYIISSWIYSRRIYKKYASHFKEFDIIYAKGFTAWCLLKNRKGHLPSVVSQLHGLEMYQQAYSFKDKLVKFLLRIPANFVIKRSDYLFSYGGQIKRILEKIGKKPSRIIEQYGAVNDFWLNPEPKEKQNANTRKFLFVARHEFRKGYHILQPAIESIIQKNMPFHLDIVGEIPEHLQIQNPSIIYHGNLSAENIKALNEDSEIILVPSLAEGFPTILVESMARGLAPIATDVGAVSALVNNENGWLINPGSIAELEAAMTQSILSDKRILEQKQIKSRLFVEKTFNWEHMHKILVTNLENIIYDNR